MPVPPEPDATPPAPRPEARPEARHGAAGEARPARSILVVDDEPFVRDVVARLLESEGYRTRTASGGDDALSELAENGADLLLTALTLQDVTGEELARRARELHPDLHVLFMYGGRQGGVNGKAVGHPLLVKPFGSRDLCRAMDALFDGGPNPSGPSPSRPA